MKETTPVLNASPKVSTHTFVLQKASELCLMSLLRSSFLPQLWQTLFPPRPIFSGGRISSFAELLEPLHLVDKYLGLFQRAGIRFEVWNIAK